MKFRTMVTAFSIVGFGLAPVAAAFADRPPPANAKPLSGILANAQQQGSGQVVEADFDHGRWEVTACKKSACQKYYFDPVTGTKQGQRHTDFEHGPRAGSKSIVSVVKQVEAARIGTITGVDFDHGHWKVELAISQ